MEETRTCDEMVGNDLAVVVCSRILGRHAEGVPA
jgi:hypothetical protein